jgi:hypothetical protein
LSQKKRGAISHTPLISITVLDQRARVRSEPD